MLEDAQAAIALEFLEQRCSRLRGIIGQSQNIEASLRNVGKSQEAEQQRIQITLPAQEELHQVEGEIEKLRDSV
jgi:hypothetical protein